MKPNNLFNPTNWRKTLRNIINLSTTEIVEFSIRDVEEVAMELSKADASISAMHIKIAKRDKQIKALEIALAVSVFTPPTPKRASSFKVS